MLSNCLKVTFVNRAGVFKRLPIIPSLTLKPLTQCNGESPTKAVTSHNSVIKTNGPEVEAVGDAAADDDDVYVINVDDDNDDTEVIFDPPKRSATPTSVYVDKNSNDGGRIEPEDLISVVAPTATSPTMELPCKTEPTTPPRTPKRRRKPEKARVSKVVVTDGSEPMMTDPSRLTPGPTSEAPDAESPKASEDTKPGNYSEIAETVGVVDKVNNIEVDFK